MPPEYKHEANSRYNISDPELSQCSDADNDTIKLRKISSQEVDNSDFSQEGDLRERFDVGEHYHGYLPHLICNYCGEQITPEEDDLWDHLVEHHPRRIILAEYRFKGQKIYLAFIKMFDMEY